MTKSQRAAELARLAWLADSGWMVVASLVPDVNRDVAAILGAIGPHLDGVSTKDRARVACYLFASAAMTEAVRLGYIE